MEKAASVRNYLSLVKFSHTVFAMPFALIGFLLAARSVDFIFDWMLAVKVLLCMVFARTAAMAYNRYADRKIDALNPRTAIREIPAGIIKADSALLFTLANATAFIATTYFINPLCFYLSPVALLVVLGYSFTKRFTALCHIVLGLGLALAPTGAYLAVTGQFAWAPVLLSLAVLCWVSGFDIIYAMQDERFDRENNLFSIPAVLGGKKALMVSNLLHFLSTCFIFSVGFVSHFGLIYFAGSVFFLALLIYQHSIVKPDDLSKVNLAFFTTNGIASVVFALFVCCDLYF